MKHLSVIACMLALSGCAATTTIGNKTFTIKIVRTEAAYPTAEQRNAAAKAWTGILDVDALVEGLAGLPKEDGNAAEKYIWLLDCYAKEAIRSGTREIPPDSPVFKYLFDGSKKNLCDFSKVRKRKGVPKMPIRRLNILGNYAAGLAQRVRKRIKEKDFKGARADVVVLLHFNWHLVKWYPPPQTRVHALAGLARAVALYGDLAAAQEMAADVEKAQAALKRIEEFKEKTIEKVLLITNTSDYSSLAAQVKVALEDEDWVYRSLAAGALMVLRFRARRIDDREGIDYRIMNSSFRAAAEDALKKMAESDPLENMRKDAMYLLEITEEQLDQSGVDFFGEQIRRRLKGTGGVIKRGDVLPAPLPE